jgi:hypothetical protein
VKSVLGCAFVEEKYRKQPNYKGGVCE